MVARGQAEGAITVRPGSVWTWCSESVQGKEEQEQHREAAQGGRADGQHQLTIVVERRPARPQDLLNRPLERADGQQQNDERGQQRTSLRELTRPILVRTD